VCLEVLSSDTITTYQKCRDKRKRNQSTDENEIRNTKYAFYRLTVSNTLTDLIFLRGTSMYRRYT